MRSTSLTQSSHYRDGKLCHIYTFDGEGFEVFDSARNLLLVIELFQDEELLEQDKQDILLCLLFPDPIETFERVGADRSARFLEEILWDACGLDVSGTHEGAPEKVFDWDEDASRIQASFLKAYGLPWEQASRGLSFFEVCALLGELLEDETTTPFQQAIYYRTASEPDFGKGNEKARDNWRAARGHFALKHTNERIDPGTAAENASRDLFSALKTAALSGGEA